jgi:hypothetical protein
VSEYIWDPLTPAQVGSLFAAWKYQWWIGGGWALDLFRNEVSRPHEDIDIVVLRRELSTLHEALSGWELHMADPPGTLRLWAKGEPFPDRAHDIWCRPSAGEPWRVQLMVADAEGDRWFFRRDQRIHGSLATFGLERDGLPILAPEIQLLYKSSVKSAAGRRPKDEADYQRTLPYLDSARRQWLHEAITLLQPDHPWLDDLATRVEDRDAST